MLNVAKKTIEDYYEHLERARELSPHAYRAIDGLHLSMLSTLVPLFFDMTPLERLETHVMMKEWVNEALRESGRQLGISAVEKERYAAELKKYNDRKEAELNKKSWLWERLHGRQD